MNIYELVVEMKLLERRAGAVVLVPFIVAIVLRG
jgi:hypothetical protein